MSSAPNARPLLDDPLGYCEAERVLGFSWRTVEHAQCYKTLDAGHYTHTRNALVYDNDSTFAVASYHESEVFRSHHRRGSSVLDVRFSAVCVDDRMSS